MLPAPTTISDAQRASAICVDRRLRTDVPALRRPILTLWEEDFRLVLDHGRPWMFGPLESDPLTTRRGGYPLPDHVRAELNRLSEAGATFDRIALAHEVDPSRVTDLECELAGRTGLRLTPRRTGQLVGRPSAAEEPVAAAKELDRVVRRVAELARRSVRGLGATAAAVAVAPFAVLDPVVFGVAGLDAPAFPGQPVLCYPLAAWHW